MKKTKFQRFVEGIGEVIGFVGPLCVDALGAYGTVKIAQKMHNDGLSPVFTGAAMAGGFLLTVYADGKVHEMIDGGAKDLSDLIGDIHDLRAEIAKDPYEEILNG